MPFSPKSSPAIHEYDEGDTPANSLLFPRRRRAWWDSFGGILSPLRLRNYRLLFGGQLVSSIGDEFYLVALPWFMLNSGGGPQALGLVLAAYGIPRAASLLLGGPLSDKLGPRKIMLLSDSVRAFLIGLLALAVLLHPALWLLCVISAFNGAFTGFFTPAAWSITSYLLADEDLQAGNALNTGQRDGAGIVGSSVAGIVVSLFQPAIAFLFDALSFVVSALTLAAMHDKQTASELRVSSRTDEQLNGVVTQAQREEGQGTMTFWQLWRSSRFLRTTLIRVTFMNLGGGAALGVALPVFAHDGLRSGASGYGFILTAFALGALLGALSAGSLGKMPHRYIIGTVFFIMQAVAMTLIPLLGSVVVVSLAMLIAGIMNGLGNVIGATLMQQVLPRSLMGRIMGALALTNFGFYPLSVALGGLAVTLYGPLFIFLLNGVLIVVPCLYAIAFLREFWHI